MIGSTGDSVIRLSNGGWIVGQVVDFDDDAFYVAGVTKLHKARKLFELNLQGVTAVPHEHVAEFRTNPRADGEVAR